MGKLYPGTVVQILTFDFDFGTRSSKFNYIFTYHIGEYFMVFKLK